MRLFRRSPSTPGSRQRQAGSDRQRVRKVFSYHAQRSEEELNTGRHLQRTPVAAAASFSRLWIKRFGLAVLLVALAVSAVNVMSLSSNAQVLSLASGGSSSFLHSRATYQAAADKLLAGSIWNHNKITIDTAKISRQLRGQFPELSSVGVTLPLIAHRPVIYIQATQPALVLEASNGSFILDTTGKALLVSSGLAASQLNLPVVADKSGLRVTINRQILTAANVSFIQTVVAQLASRHFTVSGMTLPATASELDVNLAGQPYFVKFNLQNNDPRQQAGTFLATQAQLQKQNITPAKYVDVRVDGRAYYQ